MTDLLSKLTTYNIFNYLLPGSVFVFICNFLEIISFETDSLIVEFFVYYLAGMTISRIGSIIIEPLFKALHIVRYAPYSDYLKAVSADSKIDLLLEANNTYRTIVAMFISILIAAGIMAGSAWLGLSDKGVGLAVGGALTVLYTLAYRKQTAYIRKRVEHQSTL